MEIILFLIIFLILLEVTKTQIPINGCFNPQYAFGTSFQVSYGQSPNNMPPNLNRPYAQPIVSSQQQTSNNQPYPPYGQNPQGYTPAPYPQYSPGTPTNYQPQYGQAYGQSTGYPSGYGQGDLSIYQNQGQYSTPGYPPGYGTSTPAPFGEATTYSPYYEPNPTTGPYTFAPPGQFEQGQQFETGYRGQPTQAPYPVTNQLYGQGYTPNQPFGGPYEGQNPTTYQYGNQQQYGEPNQAPYYLSDQNGEPQSTQIPYPPPGQQYGGQPPYSTSQPYNGPTSTPYPFTNQPQSVNQQFSQTPFPLQNQPYNGPTSTPYPPQQTQAPFPPNQQQFQPIGSNQNGDRYSFEPYRQNPYLYDNQQLSTRFPYFLDPYKKK